MTDLRKAAEMALEALEQEYSGWSRLWPIQSINAIQALRQALAQPGQETMPDDLIAAYEKGFKEGELAEREACAKVVEEWLHGDWHNQGVVAAAMIRARGEK